MDPADVAVPGRKGRSQKAGAGAGAGAGGARAAGGAVAAAVEPDAGDSPLRAFQCFGEGFCGVTRCLPR